MDILIFEIWACLLAAAVLGGGLYALLAPASMHQQSSDPNNELVPPSETPPASASLTMHRRLAAVEAEPAEARTQLDHVRARNDKPESASAEVELRALRRRLVALTEMLDRARAQNRARREPQAMGQASPLALTRHGAPSAAGSEPPVHDVDDLKRIKGIGPVLEKRLNRLGICRYEQIAGWGPREIEDYSVQLATFASRIHRDRWIERARDELERKNKGVG